VFRRSTDAPPDPAASSAAPEIVSKIQWLMFFRVIMVTVLLGSTLIVNVKDADLLSDPGTLTVLGLIVGTYLLTIAYALLLPRLKQHRAFAYIQLVGDLLTSFVLILLTGGVESVFTFMFALTVMNGAILLFRRGAITMALLSAVLIGLIVVRDWAHMPDVAVSPSASRGIVLWAMTNVSAVLLVALLAGYLSDQLSFAGQRLQSQSEDLEQLRTLNQHIITSLQSGLLSHTLDGRVIFFNQAAERITGLRADDVLYQDVRTIFPRLEPDSATVSDAAGAAMNRWEETFETPDGQVRVLGMSRSPLVDSGGASRGAVVVFQDLTPMRSLEQQIRRSEKFAAIGKMAAGIAHEIRNPLTSISGSIQMLKRGANLDKTDSRLMEIVLREVERLNALITDFLRFARPAPPQLARTHIGALMSEVIEVFRYMQSQGEGGPRYDVDLMVGDSVIVQADPRQLKQVIWNLLNNAVDAMPAGGLIQMQAVVTGKSGADDDGVELRLSDTGVGITAENLSRVFDPFFSTKPRGSGLGLALVHRIVEEHGGTIHVESEPGKGTTMIIRLPAPANAPVVRQPSPSELLT
jgi:two-component system sensor histidine kinase PilS (NtrC family)